MNIVLNRKIYNDSCTIGRLLFDGVDKFWTLEDKVRAKDEAKVYGKTAIPAGKYQIIVNISQRFGREMCLLLSVPGFEGIRIHGGNTEVDTLGCILVAVNKVSDTKIQGTAEAKVLNLVKSAIARRESVWITINDHS